MEKFKKIFEEHLNKFLSDIEEKEMYDFISYQLSGGGKRLRPVLMLMAYNLFDEDFTNVLDFALAIEMIHNYSLVHDDLPAMDDDDYRRGKLTLHKKFNEAIAILTGDALLNLAYETMSKDIINSSSDLQISKLKAFEFISKMAGYEGMILGQIMDINDSINNLEEMKKMYILKTSNLFRASIVAGGLIAKAPIDIIDTLDSFANYLGQTFQIADDLKDYEEDIKIGKVTILTLQATKKDQILEEYYELTMNELNKLKSKGLDVSNFVKLLDSIII